VSDLSLNRTGEFNNLGGILPFYFVPVDEIDSIEDIIFGAIESITYVTAGFNPYIIEIVQESGKFIEEKQTNTRFDYTIAGNFAKDELDVRNILDKIDGEKFVLMVPDTNGKYRVIGSVDNPVIHFNTKLDKGTNVSDLNAYDLVFTWASKYRAAFINESSF